MKLYNLDLPFAQWASEVFDSLPPALQECFTSGDVDKLVAVSNREGHINEPDADGWRARSSVCQI